MLELTGFVRGSQERPCKFVLSCSVVDPRRAPEVVILSELERCLLRE